MEGQFVDDVHESNCQLGRQLEPMEAVGEAAGDRDAVAPEDAKIVATSAETEDTSPEIVVAEDVAGNFHHLCLSIRRSREVTNVK